MGAPTALCGIALLWVLGLGQGPVAGLNCGPGCFLRGTDTHLRCCCSCAPEQEVCPKGNCVCMQPEFHCEDPECRTCKHHPCPPGQEARPQGAFKFGFECIDCAVGTFSAGHEGRCRPWADCAQSGFITMFPGNKTHNAMCIPGPLPAESHGQLIIIFAVAICILLLNTAQLSLHIWQLRRQHTQPRETQPCLKVPLPPAEDADSCQFPEEERGERLEEKGHLGDRWP
ncbi:tumor necrosis factor receptor superfamily member 18 isoform X2 [Perognathus longimembris pacificus]|uniref:tumor necrosis factor receptor superfamily member 18 isoform X2 n=1 Tax=Perognathus longimembris pacificus TaxID=214514 RepID=UPI002018E3C0|nr:tumor necrosis factor receptor superfamily member 18 isoform X2 [Perognathus longimembris pacificus]